ncbi:MAG: class I SAM-dependent methyltransferase [Spirochaetota bacterium]|nr:class I SAM-dependent methyltransferase [Spirochaetota bacterium]
MKDSIGNALEAWRVRRVLPEIEGNLLDIGCGNNRLVRVHGNGIGVDVFPWEGIDLLVEDASRLPFDDNTFDTVTFLACLNHIPNRNDVLREAHRLLKPGGKIVVTMIPPRLSRIWHFLRRPWERDQHERGMKKGEVYGLTRRQVKELLERNGFEIRRQYSFMFQINSITTGFAVTRIAAEGDH